MDLFDVIDARASAVRLQDPGPCEEHLYRILRAGTRAPDHGRLSPWRFIVIEANAREKLAEAMAAALKQRMPDSTDAVLDNERAKAFRAPTIVAVAARVARNHKVPDIEQVMAVAAGVQNMLLAASALGYGSMWKTGNPAYSPSIKEALGLAEYDHIVAFLYLGTSAQPQRSPRDVSLDELVSRL